MSEHEGTVEKRLRDIEDRLIARSASDATQARSMILRKHGRLSIIQSVIALASVSALILVVFGSTYGQHQLNKTQANTCQVVAAKIQDDIRLRNIQTVAARKQLHSGRAYLSDIRRLVQIIEKIPKRKQSAGLRVFGDYFRNAALLTSTNDEATRRAVRAANKTVRDWKDLGKKLACN